MSNRPVPAAAEGLPQVDLSELEDRIDTARMSAKLADYLATEVLGGVQDDTDTVRTTGWERDLLLFATLRAVNDAQRAMDGFVDFTRTGR